MIVEVISSNGFFNMKFNKKNPIYNTFRLGFFIYIEFFYFSTNPIAIEVEDCSETKTSLFS